MANGLPAGQTPKPRASRVNRQTAIRNAVQAVERGILKAQPTMDANTARQFARVALTRPGVSIGRGGRIFFQGQRYAPAAFANSHLVQQATGLLASNRNQAAIQGDPQYMQTVAQLAQARDQSVAGLQDQQRQALIEYGDPTFAGSDAQTAAAASANPFSTASLERQNYQNSLQATREQANRLGTSAGGGGVSGQQFVQQQYAGQVQDAVTKLQQLLASVATEQAAAGQSYSQGRSQAALDAYNALLNSGAIHAAAPPKWGVGTFNVRPVAPGNRSGGHFGGNAPGGGGGFIPPINRGGAPGGPVRVLPNPTGSPIAIGSPTTPLPGRPILGPEPYQPLNLQSSMSATLRRYGLGG